jgi:hypothetical protein
VRSADPSHIYLLFAAHTLLLLLLPACNIDTLYGEVGYLAAHTKSVECRHCRCC